MPAEGCHDPPRTAPDTNPVPTLCPECAHVVLGALAALAPELRSALEGMLAPGGKLRPAGWTALATT